MTCLRCLHLNTALLYKNNLIFRNWLEVHLSYLLQGPFDPQLPAPAILLSHQSCYRHWLHCKINSNRSWHSYIIAIHNSIKLHASWGESSWSSPLAIQQVLERAFFSRTHTSPVLYVYMGEEKPGTEDTHFTQAAIVGAWQIQNCIFPGKHQAETNKAVVGFSPGQFFSISSTRKSVRLRVSFVYFFLYQRRGG